MGVHFERIENVLQSDVGHHRVSIVGASGQAVHHQHVDGVSDRHAAGPEPLAQVLLGEGSAGIEVSEQDLPTQLLGYLQAE